MKKSSLVPEVKQTNEKYQVSEESPLGLKQTKPTNTHTQNKNKKNLPPTTNKFSDHFHVRHYAMFIMYILSSIL